MGIVRLLPKLTMGTLILINNKKVSANFYFRNSFSMRAIFVRTLHICLDPNSKMLWAGKLRDTLNKRRAKFALTSL